MKLVVYCEACDEETAIRSQSSTRPDLEMERGANFVLNCKSCGKNNAVHINEVTAKQSNIIFLGSLAISALVTIALWKFLGAVGTITLGIPLMIWKQQMDSVHGFNRYKRRR